MTTGSYVLYSETLAGSIAPEVMLKEIGADYQVVKIDMAVGEHRQPAYRALNPAGQVPALRLPEGDVIGESAAIMILLGERHAEANLSPGINSARRAQFLRWMNYMSASVYMSYVHYSHPDRYTTDQSSLAPIQAAAMNKLMEQFAVLENAISGKPYFFPEGYGALDIYLAMLVEFSEDPSGLCRQFEKIGKLYDAVSRRPHYITVMKSHRPVG